jgi:hypothetical protein
MSCPLAGRLKISQSRSCPRPPSETVPVPIPPSGNAISFRAAPVNRRGGDAAPPVGPDVLGVAAARDVVVVDMRVS